MTTLDATLVTFTLSHVRTMLRSKVIHAMIDDDMEPAETLIEAMVDSLAGSVDLGMGEGGEPVLYFDGGDDLDAVIRRLVTGKYERTR